MDVTLEVSRLSGWLNAAADCRVEREAYKKGRHAGRVAEGREWAVAAKAARRQAPIVEAAGRARAERTRNMDAMDVTLEVSRLSGWLNADADCRVEWEA
jgi:hypothetical protein